MTARRHIEPLRDLGRELYSIEKPARYLGGEIGSYPAIQPDDPRLRIALCFPDLYEIGMSNNAIRILYNDLGGFSSDLVCERVFAAAPDFEALLKRKNIPLYTLESGIPLNACDIIGFSLGYELLATNVLAVLDAGGIPLLRRKRGEGDPIVLAGGPAATNPQPFADFLDAVYIGEAEGEFYALAKDLARIKKQGAGRRDLLERMGESEAIWMPPDSPRRSKKASRALFSGFSASAAFTAYPIPVIKAVQSHGSVEIMRGCPNGCRFCHAGYYYRPQRVKSAESIADETRSLVEAGGYREITLSSLSSGDYPGLVDLFRALNDTWKNRFVSFQLPSLKVDSFTLPLLAELSEVRKSGLTFAVETAVESWQRAINKTVSFEKVAAILKEAKSYGFRSAKFYFMIGLPVPGRGRGEGEAIVDFLARAARLERMALNVNIGTFVPKPHTPYEREAQIGEQEALDTIYYIKDALRPYKNISIAYHSPFTSLLEGIISRGDAQAGDMILSAYSKGARMDAWEEYFDKELWKSVLAERAAQSGIDPRQHYTRARAEDEALPWGDINLFIGKKYLKDEAARSAKGELTAACAEDCDRPCGACNDKTHIVLNNRQSKVESGPFARRRGLAKPENRGFCVAKASLSTLDDRRLVVSYKKSDTAVFYPLHSISGIFERAFFMLDLPVRYGEGFNPLPKMEFTQPLALGIQSDDDIMAVWLAKELEILSEKDFIAAFNAALPRGLRVGSLRLGRFRREGKNTIGSLYWGSRYEMQIPDEKARSAWYAAAQGSLGQCAVPGGGGAAVSETPTGLSLLLQDARGGEQNIARLLERWAELAGEDALAARAAVKRAASLSASPDSLHNSLQRLFDVL